MSGRFLCAVAVVIAGCATDSPVSFSPPLEQREKAAMLASPDLTPELRAIVLEQRTSATPAEGEALSAIRAAAQKALAEKDFEAARAREAAERTAALQATRRERESEEQERRAAAAAPEVAADDPQQRPLAPRDQASQDVRTARTCVAFAERRIAYIREVEKASGSPAPAATAFKAGEELLACRAFLAEAQKRCKALKC